MNIDQINFYTVFTASNVSGAASSKDNIIDNYYGTTFKYDGEIDRLLRYTKDDKVDEVIDNSGILYDHVIMLVNTTKYGGAGGEFAVTSTTEGSANLILHELGHSLAKLGDEYFAGDEYTKEAINVTKENNPEEVKWHEYIGENGIGVYPMMGSDEWFVPHEGCKMRHLNSPFCNVCQDAIRESIEGIIAEK